MPKNEENLTEEITAEVTDEVAVDAAEMPDAPDFDPDEWDRKRKEAEDAELAGARAAAKQRKESAAIIVEHDEMLADMLFEMTMNEMSEE